MVSLSFLVIHDLDMFEEYCQEFCRISLIWGLSNICLHLITSDVNLDHLITKMVYDSFLTVKLVFFLCS